ncbi:diguanylate cyclase [Faecalicatena sp. AGMB00832]|uniref:Diguanylate cyclase n=2 Tax=Faecalicatena faecalis TaxID=2726362 RepID=A0ABS6D1F4_9FIRM|nr:diguanylate cyclase [Faecalicatena faecalis]
MEMNQKKHVLMLGVRIVLVFLAAFSILVFTVYVVFSKNFQSMLTDYTMQLIGSMVDQGVISVENELNSSKEALEDFAGSFEVPSDIEQIEFPKNFNASNMLRLVYVSESGTVSSDGRELDVRERQDIRKAYTGESCLYGPYFNEEKEYVMCYSAPVYKNGRVAGVLSMEKDGYYFSNLIKNLTYANTGESYIINAEGTDIAVSNQDHISWVNDCYNARLVLREGEEAEVRSVMELEEKGLSGESGVGTYYWDDGLCYLAYAPIPSVHWVLLAGIREEELISMMKSTFITSLAEGPILQMCLIVFFIMMSLISYWIISSAKKNAAIHQKLNIIANYDTLTGTKNRNSYHTAIDTFDGQSYHSFGCIYTDVNGLHEINNRLGHQAGDLMLETVADKLVEAFQKGEVYRIGGDEFVVLCQDMEKQDVYDYINQVRQDLMLKGYEISIGVEWRDKEIDIKSMVTLAEKAMQRDKEHFYKENGKERQMRTLNQAIEQMVLEKQDADTFLSVLSPEFKGVYFVDLASDTIRHLFIPSYFEEMLKESGDKFSKAMVLYAERIVKPEFRKDFIEFCDYQNLEIQLNSSSSTEYSYQRMDGSWLTLRILKFKNYKPQTQETLWIFEVNDNENTM